MRGGDEETSVNARLRAGRAALAAGDLAAAEAAFRAAVEAEPENRPALRQLIQLLERQRRHADALTALDRLQALEPDELSLSLRRSIALAGLDRLDEAEMGLANVYERDPALPGAASHYASLLERRGRGAEAPLVLMGALRVRPNDAALWLRMGATLSGLERGREALVALRQAVNLAPDSVSAATQFVAALTKQGDAAGALHALKAAVRANPSCVPLLTMLGNAVFETDPSLAWDAYRRALVAAPGHKQAALRYVALALRAGDRATAAETLKRALAVYPNDSDLRARLDVVERPGRAAKACLEVSARAQERELVEAGLRAARARLAPTFAEEAARAMQEPQGQRRLPALADRWLTLRPEAAQEVFASDCPEATFARMAEGGAVIVRPRGPGRVYLLAALARAGVTARAALTDIIVATRLSEAGALAGCTLSEIEPQSGLPAFGALARYVADERGIVVVDDVEDAALAWPALAALARAPVYLGVVHEQEARLNLSLLRGPDARPDVSIEDWLKSWRAFVDEADRRFAPSARAGGFCLDGQAESWSADAQNLERAFPIHELASLPGLRLARPGAKWLFGADGALALAAPGEAAFDHDPGTGAAPRLLVEPAGVNLFRHPDWRGLAWRASQTGALSAGAYRVDPLHGAVARLEGEGEEFGMHYVEFAFEAPEQANGLVRMVLAGRGDGRDLRVRGGQRLTLSMFLRATDSGDCVSSLFWGGVQRDDTGKTLETYRGEDNCLRGVETRLTRLVSAQPALAASPWTRSLQPWLQIEIAAGRSVRLRFYHHQCEEGAAATSPIRTLGPYPYRRIADSARLDALSGREGKISLRMRLASGDDALLRSADGRLRLARAANGDARLMFAGTARPVIAGVGGLDDVCPRLVRLAFGPASVAASVCEGPEGALPAAAVVIGPITLGGGAALEISELEWSAAGALPPPASGDLGLSAGARHARTIGRRSRLDGSVRALHAIRRFEEDSHDDAIWVGGTDGPSLRSGRARRAGVRCSRDRVPGRLRRARLGAAPAGNQRARQAVGELRRAPASRSRCRTRCADAERRRRPFANAGLHPFQCVEPRQGWSSPSLLL